ncbi:hypothetical protein AB4259_02660 [Vibrio amylolyticus]|uniref:hypothetical protein n=1 Tax=Vibrio amylolyticus TaxID=2847292 RepID=UPI0035534D4C
MASTVTPLPSVTPPSKQQVLLQGLENTGEQVFARIVAADYGFRVSNRWNRTAKNLADDIKSTNSKFQNCTVDNLEKLVDRVIISADHHYTVYELSQGDATQVRQALTAQIGQIPTNLYAQTYPDLVDFNTVSSTTSGHYLCKVVDMGDGIACIYASVVKDPVQGYRQTAGAPMDTFQYFHTVFVPHNEDRIEVRVSHKAPAKYHEKHATSINNEFINIVGAQGVRFTPTLVNFFSCITSYFGDASVGRIAHAVLTTGQDSKDAELKSMRDKTYCARTQHVVDTRNNFNYVCRAILIRKPHIGKGSGEVSIYFFPHVNTWEANSCWSMQIKKPQSSVALNSIITDAIARS